MALPASIPLVTNDDLITFHKHAFGTAPPSHSLPYYPTSPAQTGLNDTHTSHAQYAAENDNDDDDELGYYPDGRKRTLTDEQVAMFRHSEIYNIVRARQVKRENEGFDEDEGDETSFANTEEASSAAVDITRASPAPAKRAEELLPLGEEIRVTTAGARNGAVGDGARLLDSRQKRRKLYKQKKQVEARRDDVPSRRVIREMDAALVAADEPELDY